jgi:hypothetical protein
MIAAAEQSVMPFAVSKLFMRSRVIDFIKRTLREKARYEQVKMPGLWHGVDLEHFLVQINCFAPVWPTAVAHDRGFRKYFTPL